VFCLYAEDADIFRDDQFHEYPAPDLAAFPYVNGGLFSEEIDIPIATAGLRETILQEASLGFDWSDISPTIFSDPVARTRNARLREYQSRLASLSFLDPACGSGNFLTETHLCLRRFENEAIASLIGRQSLLDLDGSTVKVSISQFHGIETNDFAVAVAKTALVSTNSACQGEAPAILWKPLFADGISIDFAHRTFRWDSESSGRAHVHCVIAGLSRRPPDSALRPCRSTTADG
jgi:hypothetical protein